MIERVDEPLFASQCDYDTEPFALEVVLQTLRDIAVVLDDQNRSNHSFSR